MIFSFIRCKHCLFQDAFVLWDTYGYPVDLTEVMGVDYGLSVDREGFDAAMEEARQKARNARFKAGENSIVLDANATAQLRNQGLASTDDSPKYGYKVSLACQIPFCSGLAILHFY
jgi:alanyl-tRNA synthetase